MITSASLDWQQNVWRTGIEGEKFLSKFTGYNSISGAHGPPGAGIVASGQDTINDGVWDPPGNI